MIADRFHRKASPKLEFIHRLTIKGRETGKAIFSMTVGIKNIGLVIARYPAMGIDAGSQFNLHPDNYGNLKYPLRKCSLTHNGSNPYHCFFAGGSDDIIYPETALNVAAFDMTMPNERVYSSQPDIVVKYVIYCDGFSVQNSLNIPWLDFQRCR